jgi:hypothetical protein
MFHALISFLTKNRKSNNCLSNSFCFKELTLKFHHIFQSKYIRQFLIGLIVAAFAGYIIPQIHNVLSSKAMVEEMLHHNYAISLYIAISIFLKSSFFLEGLFGASGFYSLFNQSLGYGASLFISIMFIFPISFCFTFFIGRLVAKRNFSYFQNQMKNLFETGDTLFANWWLTLCITFSFSFNYVAFLGFFGKKIENIIIPIVMGQFLRYILLIYKDTLYGVLVTQLDHIIFGSINFGMVGVRILSVLYLALIFNNTLKKNNTSSAKDSI